MRVVAALGGNALLRPGEPLEAETQRRNIASAAGAIAAIARSHAVVVTHGNGPQVGLLSLQAEGYARVRPYPLDVLGAETEGMIGYLIEQELRNRLPGREVATLVTQVVVDPHDPAFAEPTKPIGPRYPIEEAERLAAERGWTLERRGEHGRRTVPSPEPVRIIELGAIRLLVEAGAVVVCVGGGGIPVAVTEPGTLRGVEGVIDKDLATALLARDLAADALLLLTDVEAVYDRWGAVDARPLGRVSVAALRSRTFEPGSMAPKVEAACRFVEATGHLAGIGRLDDAAAILEGRAGTTLGGVQ
jgi:carbamate kinase